MISKKQKQIINYKFNGALIIKGEENTGKTTTAINRAIYLKDNYCLYENDNILVIVDSYEEKKNALEIYNRSDDLQESISLFSYIKHSLDIKTIDEIFEEIQLNLHFKIASEKIKYNILEKIIDKYKKERKRAKILNKCYIEFLLKEFEYIKSNRINSIDEYKNFTRRGRKSKEVNAPKSLPKNSSIRDCIYKLMDIYYEGLFSEKYIDEVVMEEEMLKYIQNSPYQRYNHLIIDNLNNFSKLQFSIIKGFINRKEYSNIVVTLNPKGKNIENSLGIQGVKIKELFLDVNKIKTYILKEKFEKDIFLDKKEVLKVKDKEEVMESYKFLDIRHNLDFEFSIDTTSEDEFILDPNGSGEIIHDDELLSIPIYNDIAAGEPIMINDTCEGTVSLPQYWLKGAKDSFILKVKGDSMINANINDKDFVIIRKQYNANNNDIVAVDLDGSATLKRLSIKEDKILLVPENNKYDPIEVKDENAMIIGKAIGIIKRND